jgi:hypothetical protein
LNRILAALLSRDQVAQELDRIGIAVCFGLGVRLHDLLLRCAPHIVLYEW